MGMVYAPFLTEQTVRLKTEDDLFDSDVDPRSIPSLKTMFGTRTFPILYVLMHKGAWHVTFEGDFAMHLEGLPKNTFPAKWFQKVH